MAQGSSGGFGVAKATGGSLVFLTAVPLAIALEADNPLFGTTFWYVVALACLGFGLLLSFYGWIIPSITGVQRLQTDNDTLQRDKRELERDKRELEADKGELRRDKEALERENADLRARLREANRAAERRHFGSVNVEVGATYIQTDEVRFAPETGTNISGSDSGNVRIDAEQDTGSEEQEKG